MQQMLNNDQTASHKNSLKGGLSHQKANIPVDEAISIAHIEPLHSPLHQRR